MPRWTEEDLKAYEAKHNANSKRTGARNFLQKQQDAHTRPTHHRPEKAKVDEVLRSRFCLSVDFVVTDKRLRDIPGMLETICDCLVAAGRQLAGIGNRKGVLQVRPRRNSGGNDND